MDLGLTDSIVVVTGASKGIGYACAETFAREGAQVVLVTRSAANLDAALARFPPTRHRPRTIVADLARAEDAARMADDVERDVGPIDVLVTRPAPRAAMRRPTSTPPRGMRRWTRNISATSDPNHNFPRIDPADAE